MTMVIEKKARYTYKDYEKLPEGTPYQLIGGEFVMTPAPTPQHQIVSRRLVLQLTKFVEEGRLGEVLYAPLDVYLSETETYQPDIIYISKNRLEIIGEKKIEGAPDLVMEILSPSTAYYDLRHKMHVYDKSGVKEYWIVDPVEKTVELYERAGEEFRLLNKAQGKDAVKSKILQGFEIRLETLF